MVRVLLLILLVWLIYIVIKRAFFSNNLNNTNTKTGKNSDHKQDQNIVQCASCGMHVLESESIKKNDLIICNNPNCYRNS